LFRGSDYLRYDPSKDRMESGYPKNRRANWKKLDFDRIDAAVRWKGNKVYFFRKNRYARYDMKADRVDPGYPKVLNSGSWKGVSFPRIDAAVNWGGGKVYLFYADQYIRFDIKKDRADAGYPKRVGNNNWKGVKFKPKKWTCTEGRMVRGRTCAIQTISGLKKKLGNKCSRDSQNCPCYIAAGKTAGTGVLYCVEQAKNTKQKKCKSKTGQFVKFLSVPRLGTSLNLRLCKYTAFKGPFGKPLKDVAHCGAMPILNKRRLVFNRRKTKGLFKGFKQDQCTYSIDSKYDQIIRMAE